MDGKEASPRGLRGLPWVIAVVGLGLALIGSPFALWPLVALWLVALGAAWLVGRFMLPTRWHRIAAALLLLPVLVLLGWEGGWWLIPADVAWLLLELTDRRPSRPIYH
jgi:hypothetical protein